MSGISKILPNVYYQQMKPEIIKARLINVIDSTYGGIESDATPLMMVVSDCMTPERTGVEFSGKSKYPMSFTKISLYSFLLMS